MTWRTPFPLETQHLTSDWTLSLVTLALLNVVDAVLLFFFLFCRFFSVFRGYTLVWVTFLYLGHSCLGQIKHSLGKTTVFGQGNHYFILKNLGKNSKWMYTHQISWPHGHVSKWPKMALLPRKIDLNWPHQGCILTKKSDPRSRSRSWEDPKTCNQNDTLWPKLTSWDPT